MDVRLGRSSWNGGCAGRKRMRDVRVDMTAPAKDSPGERPVIRLWHIYGSDDDQAARIMEQLTRGGRG